MVSEEDFLLASYDYQLPQERIAQFPCGEPGTSRLLVMSRFADQADLPVAARFADLPDFLPENTLLVANNCKVLPARLYGHRKSGGKMEFLLLSPLPALHPEEVEPIPQIEGTGPCLSCEAECLLRPAGKITPGECVWLPGGLLAVLLAKGEFGRCRVKLYWRGNLEDIFAAEGKMPLPPYIHREAQASDALRYQTCYAKKTGAVAAPTAGLHMTPQMRLRLEQKGIEWREVTLYVGYGTFSPVRAEDIRRHEMHSEYVQLDSETAQTINAAKKAGRPVVAVGTTSLRALEGIAALCGQLRAFSGFVDIFIYPGSNFAVVDGLITNFHLPQSSLLMLVSAFAGRKRILDAYARAIDLGFNFFSYGDAMLILPGKK